MSNSKAFSPFPYVKGYSGKIYRILENIGSGSFGKVHAASVCDEKGNIFGDHLVIKFIDAKKHLQSFQDEMQVLLDICWFKLDGLSKFIDQGSATMLQTQGMFDNSYKFFVIPRLGANMFEIFDLNRSYLKKVDILKLGIQLIQRIESFHSIGYVHLDIKPDNILINTSVNQVKSPNMSQNPILFNLHEKLEFNRRKIAFYQQPEQNHLIPSEVTLIDFGTAKNYLCMKNRRLKIHLPNEPESYPTIGRNYFFASKHYFSGQTLSRRDDIIQIVYTLIYLLNPQNFKMAEIYTRNINKSNSFEEMKAYKLNATPEDICSDQRTLCLRNILIEAYSYCYDQTPRYGVLKFLLEKELMELHCVPDKYFTWFHKGFIGRPLSAIKYVGLQSADIQQDDIQESVTINPMIVLEGQKEKNKLVINKGNVVNPIVDNVSTNSEQIQQQQQN